MSDEPIEKLYKVDDVAEMFSVSPLTVRTWLRATPPVLKALKIGNQWRVPHSELVKLAAKRYGDKDE